MQTLNPIQRAALDWLRQHGPASADQLRQAMTETGAVSAPPGSPKAQTPPRGAAHHAQRGSVGATYWLMLDQRERFWAEDCLYELYVAGHARRSRDSGEVLYCAAGPSQGAKAPFGGSAPCAAGERGGFISAADAGTATRPGVPAVAPPRRISVMLAPTLTGGDGAPMREGALDYAAIPSIINGKRVPLRAGRAAR